MKTRPRWFNTLLAALAPVLLCAGWIIFAPIQFGGQAAYAILSGNSMEPLFHRGDLVIVREALDYQVGDIVAYRHPAIGPVIHRIVDRDGDRFVLKGDHNSWLDSYQPGRDDLIGAFWIHVPSAGSVLEQLRTPRNMSILAALLGVMVMTTLTGSEDRRGWRGRGRKLMSRTTRFMAGGQAALRRYGSIRDERAQRVVRQPGESQGDALTILAALAFASLLLAAFAFTRPTSRTVIDDVGYEQTGVFSYSAAAPSGVYDSNIVQTGEPVFRRLTDTITVHFAYRLAADQAGDQSGSYRLDAEIGDASGWRRTIELQPETAFSGGAFTASGAIDLRAVQALIDSFERQTSSHSLQYTLAVIPRVAVQGALGGQELRDSFAPRLEFRLDKLQLLVVADSGRADDMFKPSKKGLLKRSREAPNTIGLLGLSLEVATARRLSLIGLAPVLGGLLALGLFAIRDTRGDEPARIRARYGPLLIAVRDTTPQDGDRVIEVATIADLARVAGRQERMIWHATQGATHCYVVQDGDVLYRYQTSDRDAAQRAAAEEAAA